jgi:hypothetical protein
VADDAEAIEAQERRAAVLGIIHAAAEAAERLPREHVADASAERGRELVVQQAFDRLDESFLSLSVTFPVKPSQTMTSASPP